VLQLNCADQTGSFARRVMTGIPKRAFTEDWCIWTIILAFRSASKLLFTVVWR